MKSLYIFSLVALISAVGQDVRGQQAAQPNQEQLRRDQLKMEAQGICPVMKKELPKNPKWTIVDGQIFYVCCPPCAEKIKADPKTFLRQLDGLYTASLQKKRAAE